MGEKERIRFIKQTQLQYASTISMAERMQQCSQAMELVRTIESEMNERDQAATGMLFNIAYNEELMAQMSGVGGSFSSLIDEAKSYTQMFRSQIGNDDG